MNANVLGNNKIVKIAIAQVKPIFMNKEKTIDKAVKYIKEAAENGADLVVFPESFIPAFPYWQEGPNDNIEDFASVNLAFRENALIVNSKDTDVLSKAAKDGSIHIVMG